MIITVGNTKGGCGKSTIAVNLAVEFAKTRSVLLVDSDVQASSMSFRAKREKDDIQSIAINTPTLHRDLKALNENKIVVVDVGGRDSAIFRSAILAADLLVIPVLPSLYDVWALEDTLSVLAEARVYKEDLKAYILLNQLLANTWLAKDVTEHVQDLKSKHDVKLMDAMLYSRQVYKNCIAAGLGVTEYPGAPDKAIQEIQALHAEICNILQL
jgi:chromosome partitioning protein